LNTVGDKSLDKVTVEDIDEVISGLMRAGRSDATVNRYLSSINVFLQWCIDRNYRTTPVPKLDWREESEGRIRWLSYDEEALMLQHSRGLIPKIIEVGINTGMRCSEILLLAEKGDVARDWVHLWKTKNNSARSVPLTPETYRTLSYLMDQGMPSYAHLRYEWDRAAKLAGLDGDDEFVFHACRHTYATRLVEANVNLRVIQTLMGHKRIETTMRYAHVHDSMLVDAAFMARSFHDSRRSVDRLTYGVQTRGLALVRDGAKRAHLGLTGRLGEQPKRRAGVAELVDAPDLGSPAKEDPDEGFTI
jgi:integrase